MEFYDDKYLKYWAEKIWASVEYGENGVQTIKKFLLEANKGKL